MNPKKPVITTKKTPGIIGPKEKNVERPTEDVSPFPEDSPDEVPKNVSYKMVKKLRHYRQIGLSFVEIADMFGLGRTMVWRLTKDVVVDPTIVNDPNSPGPKNLGDVPTASITTVPSEPQKQHITIQQKVA